MTACEAQAKMRIPGCLDRRASRVFLRSNGGGIKNLSTRWLFLFYLIFLLGCRPVAGAVLPGTQTPGAPVTVLGERRYIVRQQITLANQGPGQPEKQNIWVALIRDFSPYQVVQAMEISPGDYTLVVDEYGNHYAEFDFSNQPAGSTQAIKIDYRVTVSELAYDLRECRGDLPRDFTQPELHIESANPQIAALAGDLSRGAHTACQQVRAFYDYIGSELAYTSNAKNWGAQAALGPMGADCTEYASLLAALSRSQGIPARYFEGLLYTENGPDDITAVEHAWPDVYLPAAGWVGLDPTQGRLPADRETHFARYTPDHIIVTMGASPSVLRGSSYWSHLYWPGNSTKIGVSGSWKIERLDEAEAN